MKPPLFLPYVRTAILYFLALELFCLLGRTIAIYLQTGSLFGAAIDVSPSIHLFYNCLQFIVGGGMVLWLSKQLQLQWTLETIHSKHLLVFLGVALLFVLNNSLSSCYSSNATAFNLDIYNNLGIYFIIITLSSIWEELLYRGVIQSYIDAHHLPSASTEQQGFHISYGNVWATVLMFARHLGFFLIFDIVFALTGLLLVVIFSFAAGWMRSSTQGLLLPILFHCCCNYIYLSIHAYFATV